MKILFMCTANDLGSIPGPLLDRMEIIQLSGYDVPEKMAIAEQYLVPKAMKESGLILDEKDDNKNNEEEESADDEPKQHSIKVPESLRIEESAIELLVRWYCREAGVRNLNKHIEKITRKLVLQLVAEDEGAELTEKSARKSKTWKVNEKNLEDYVGKPIFTSDRLYEKDPLPHGIVMGLAWTSMGGKLIVSATSTFNIVFYVSLSSLNLLG